MKSIKQFLHSFKHLRKQFLYVLIIDIVVALLLFGGINYWTSMTKETYQQAEVSISALEAMKATGFSSPDFAMHAANLQSFYKGFFVNILLLVLFIFLLWTVTRAVVWHIILRKKLTTKLTLKFILLHLVWQPANILLWSIFLLIMSLFGRLVQAWAMRQTSTFMQFSVPLALSFLIAMPLLLILINITNLLNLYFARHHSFSKAFIYLFTFFFTKTHKLIIPYYLVSFVFLVLSLLLLPFRNHTTFYLYASLLGMAIILAWMKFYLVDLERALS